jgi:hypothetical protein
LSELQQVGGYFPSTPVSSTNKTDHHNITETWLKVALSTHNPNTTSNDLLKYWLWADKYYTRNASCALSQISTYLLNLSFHFLPIKCTQIPTSLFLFYFNWFSLLVYLLLYSTLLCFISLLLAKPCSMEWH